MWKRELFALLNLSSWYLVMVEWLFLAVPWGCQRFVIVVFPDHTRLLFCGRLLGNDWYLGFFCVSFCLFITPGSSVVLDCINSWSLPSFLLYNQVCRLSNNMHYNIAISRQIIFALNAYMAENILSYWSCSWRFQCLNLGCTGYAYIDLIDHTQFTSCTYNYTIHSSILLNWREEGISKI